MRRSILSLALVLFPAALAAQGGPIDPGSIVLGGSVSFTSSGGDLYENAEGDRATTITINPRALFFVMRGLAVGGDVLISTSSQGDFDSTTLGIGPAAYYFFGGPNARIYPFIGASVGYAKVSVEDFDGSGLVYGPTAGVAFLLSESVALTTAATYRMENVSIDEIDEDVDGNVFSIDVGIQAFMH